MFDEQIMPYLDRIIRPYPKKICVERGMDVIGDRLAGLFKSGQANTFRNTSLSSCILYGFATTPLKPKFAKSAMIGSLA